MSWDQLREMGSSPRIRGKPEPHAQRRRAPGLIPAHTGKTHRVNQGFILSWAHPRAYGENVELPALSTQFRGSSPRIRGKLRWFAPVDDVPRLIPAHTGNTRWRGRHRAPLRAHPRAYGENNAYALRTGLIQGSPPRVRGTQWAQLSPTLTWAHPRAYGEHLPTRHDTRAKTKKYLVSTRIHI